MRYPDSRFASDIPIMECSMHADARKDIASLRLVNKIFHQFATPVLFKCYNACFPTPYFLESDAWAGRLLDIGQRAVVEEVQKLSIGFKRGQSCEWN